jgi:Cu2+-exporting ATPase
MVMAPSEAMGHGGHAGMSMEAMVRDMRNRFLVALVLSIPIVLWSPIGRQVLHFLVPAPFGLRDDVFQLLLSLPVIFYSSWIFFDGAFRALRQRTLDMMVLVAVAIGSGWLYSLVVTLRGAATSSTRRPASSPPSCCSGTGSRCGRGAVPTTPSAACSTWPRRGRC